MSEPNQASSNRSRWRENVLALLIALVILGFIVLSAGGAAPFIYGKF